MSHSASTSLTRAWLESLRPRTLPLAFASIVCGSALAYWQDTFDPLIAFLALVTAGLLHILSNLANDFGDAVKASYKEDRIYRKGVREGKRVDLGGRLIRKIIIFNSNL